MDGTGARGTVGAGVGARRWLGGATAGSGTVATSAGDGRRGDVEDPDPFSPTPSQRLLLERSSRRVAAAPPSPLPPARPFPLAGPFALAGPLVLADPFPLADPGRPGGSGAGRRVIELDDEVRPDEVAGRSVIARSARLRSAAPPGTATGRRRLTRAADGAREPETGGDGGRAG
ncbi:MAG: hypothetical protein H0U21_02825 [Acidimicrobiia bacterium]|nr:hypothetical protein [Acidimicrobiia bacterium]